MFGLFRKKASTNQAEEKLREAEEQGRRFAEAEINRAVQALKFVYDAQVEVTNEELSKLDFSDRPQLENNLNLTRMIFQFGFFAAGGQVLIGHSFKQAMGEEPDEPYQLARVAARRAISEFPIANNAVISLADGDTDALFGLVEAAAMTETHKPAFEIGVELGKATAYGFLTEQRPEIGVGELHVVLNAMEFMSSTSEEENG